MKILVATKEMQGVRKNDFAWANEGELLTFASECDGEKVDGRCGCRRAMSGLDTKKATTTMKVVDRPDMTVDKLTDLMAASLVAAGWFTKVDAECRELAAMTAKDVERIARAFPAGVVLERRGDDFVLRQPAKPKRARKH